MINHILESPGVPAFDVAAEGVDAALERCGELGLPVDAFTLQLAVQHAGGHARRAHGDGHAGGEHRVEEFRGVAEQRKARTVQGFDVGRVAADGARRGIPHGVFQHAGQAWGFSDEAAQALIQILDAAFEVFGCRDHAHRATAVAERDGPEPDIAVDRMGGDEDFFPLEGRAVDMVFDVGEHRLAHREIRRCFKVQQARQHAAVAAGIEHEIGFDAVLAAVFAQHIELRFRQARNRR